MSRSLPLKWIAFTAALALTAFTWAAPEDQSEAQENSRPHVPGWWHSAKGPQSQADQQNADAQSPRIDPKQMKRVLEDIRRRIESRRQQRWAHGPMQPHGHRWPAREGNGMGTEGGAHRHGMMDGPPPFGGFDRPNFGAEHGAWRHGEQGPGEASPGGWRAGGHARFGYGFGHRAPMGHRMPRRFQQRMSRQHWFADERHGRFDYRQEGPDHGQRFFPRTGHGPLSHGFAWRHDRGFQREGAFRFGHHGWGERQQMNRSGWGDRRYMGFGENHGGWGERPHIGFGENHGGWGERRHLGFGEDRGGWGERRHMGFGEDRGGWGERRHMGFGEDHGGWGERRHTGFNEYQGWGQRRGMGFGENHGFMGRRGYGEEGGKHREMGMRDRWSRMYEAREGDAGGEFRGGAEAQWDSRGPRGRGAFEDDREDPRPMMRRHRLHGGEDQQDAAPSHHRERESE